MKGCNEGNAGQDAALDPLESRLRDGLWREAQSAQPEAQAFWSRIALRMAKRQRDR